MIFKDCNFVTYALSLATPSICSYVSFHFVPAKPIDLMAEYVNPKDDDFELQVNEPYCVLVVSILNR